MLAVQRSGCPNASKRPGRDHHIPATTGLARDRRFTTTVSRNTIITIYLQIVASDLWWLSLLAAPRLVGGPASAALTSFLLDRWRVRLR
jgi:hypothetical protein